MTKAVIYCTLFTCSIFKSLIFICMIVTSPQSYRNHDRNCRDHRDRNFSCNLNKTIKKINWQYRNNGIMGTVSELIQPYRYQLHTVLWITKHTGILPNFNVHQTISLMKGEPLGGKGLTLLISESQWYDIYLKHLK